MAGAVPVVLVLAGSAVEVPKGPPPPSNGVVSAGVVAMPRPSTGLVPDDNGVD